MRKKIIICNTLIIVIALALMFGLGILVTRDNNYNQAKEKITQVTKIYANNYSTEENYTEKIDENIRITVIDATGTVISDSHMEDTSTIENHISREEIIAALNDDPKTVIRFSSTLGKDMIYYAEKVQTGDTYVFVRVAIPVGNVNMFVSKTIVLMLGILIGALVISFLASVFFSSGLLKPLNNVKSSLESVAEGSYTTVMPTTDDEDVNQIISEINVISETIKKMMVSSLEDKQKLDYIINNVTDGIVVFGSDQKITLINTNAKEIFGIEEAVGKGLLALTANKDLTDSVSSSIDNKKSSIFEATLEDRIYLCSVKYTENDLVIVVLSDISAARNNEKMRSEFFANASHELKTPLTSIKGFNELIMLKSKDKDIIPFSEKITKESGRMLMLIDDMLNLSRLENSQEINKTELDVKTLADEVIDSLTSIAKEKNVTVKVCGEAKLLADKEHIFELIKNLVENAIRYNKYGGKVDISLASINHKTILTVADNGIGIENEHQRRIFERFYRVNKSRSRETGGTGLGLSIVKHIAELYNADLKLTSKLGVGTEITVIFPNN